MMLISSLGMAHKLNDIIVYNKSFAQQFELAVEEAIELPDGLMAVRVYWSFSNRTEQKDPAPKVQLFINESIPINLSDDEGIWVNHYGAEKSGFLGFSKTLGQYNEKFDQEQYEEFYNRIVVIGDGDFTTETIDQYTKDLVPGIQAVEFGSLISTLTPPFDVYLYTGNNPSSDSVNLMINTPGDFEKYGFTRFRLPKAANQALKQPYKK